MNVLKIQGICTCTPQFQYEKNRLGHYMPVCRYILAARRPKSNTADYIYCVAFGERAIVAHEEIQNGTEVFIQGHLHTEFENDSANQKIYYVMATVDYQKIIKKVELCGPTLNELPPQFPNLKKITSTDNGGK